MKRYLLFAGAQYYPSGGAEDFQGSYDTWDEAMAAPIPEFLELGFDWAHIADGDDNLRIVAQRDVDLGHGKWKAVP